MERHDGAGGSTAIVPARARTGCSACYAKDVLTFGKGMDVTEPAIRAAFAAEFKNWGLELPEGAEASGSGRVENSHGWNIQYRFGRNDEVYMDVYARHRMTNARLYRYHQDGSTETLGLSADMFSGTPEGKIVEAEFLRRVAEHGF